MISRDRLLATPLMSPTRLKRESVMHSRNNRGSGAAGLPSSIGYGKAGSIIGAGYARQAKTVPHRAASQPEFYLIIIASLLFTAFATFLTLLPVFL